MREGSIYRKGQISNKNIHVNGAQPCSPKSMSSNAALAPSTRIFLLGPVRALCMKYTPSVTRGRSFSANPWKSVTPIFIYKRPFDELFKVYKCVYTTGKKISCVILTDIPQKWTMNYWNLLKITTSAQAYKYSKEGTEVSQQTRKFTIFITNLNLWFLLP